MNDKNMPSVQEAISDLAGLGQYWGLLADMQPEVFLAEVKAEIMRLRALCREAQELLEFVTHHDGRYDQHTRHDWQRRAQEFLRRLREAGEEET